MSQYLAAPRTGHLEAIYGIVRYLAIKPDRRLMMSPTKVEYSDTVENSFNKDEKWEEFYREVIEEDPAGMPTPLGQPVKIRAFLDVDHTGNIVTRRSHTGIHLRQQLAHCTVQQEAKHSRVCHLRRLALKWWQCESRGI
jgi:hypothetical protein